MNKTQFESTIAEIIDVPTDNFEHPFLTKVKFVFTDNKGNANKQGIETDDFDMVAKSSIHMPLKIRYTHAGAGGHDLSVPFGHMTNMYKEVAEDGTAQLIGEGVLYKEEYPDEVQYLKDAHENGKAPGISWELSYQDSISKAGIDWLKGVVTRAATFVKFPAYGNRTGLLAVAQNNILAITESQMMDIEFMDELKEIVDELNKLVQGIPETEDDEEEDHQDELLMGGASQNTGGNEVEELEKAQAELDAALAKIAELNTQLETAQSTITDLTTENEGFKRQALVAERTAKIVEAGIKIESDQEKLAQKQELWLAMSPEIFDAYVTDLAEASKPTQNAPKDKAAASSKEGLPKFTAVAGQEKTLDDLKQLGRVASRGIAAEL
jgi:hypothetical protein